MKPRSAKNKGNRFEKYIVNEFKNNGIYAHRTPGSGSGLDKNDVLIPDYRIEIEAKNQKKINLCNDWEQMQRQTMGANWGILAIRNPKKSEFKEVFCVISLLDFIELIKKTGEGKNIKEPNKELKYKLNNLRISLNKVLKELK